MRNPQSHPNLIPLYRWNDHFNWPSVKAIRHYVSKSDENGFAKAIKRVGNRILIDVDAFFEWVNQQSLKEK